MTFRIFALTASLVLFCVHSMALELKIEGIANTKGVIQLAVWDSSAGFPQDYEKAALLKTFQINQTGVQVENLELTGAEPGKIAIALYHDENEDVVLNTNFFGIPREGFGFSNNPVIRFGPPSFEEVTFNSQEVKEISVKINYP